MSTNNNNNTTLINIINVEDFLTCFRVVDLLVLKKVCKSIYDLIRSKKYEQYRPENAMKLIYFKRFNKSKKYEEGGQYLWDHYITSFDNVIAGSLNLECLYLPLKNILWDRSTLKYKLEDVQQNELTANDIDVFEINREDSMTFFNQENEKCLKTNDMPTIVTEKSGVRFDTCTTTDEPCHKCYNHPNEIYLYQSEKFNDNFDQYRMCGILNRMCVSILCDEIKHNKRDFSGIPREYFTCDYNELSKSPSRISVHRFDSDGTLSMKELIDKSFDFEFLKIIATSTTFQVKDIMSVVCKKSDYNMKNQYAFDILKRIHFLDNIGKTRLVEYRPHTNIKYPIIRGNLYDDDNGCRVTLNYRVSELPSVMKEFLIQRLDQRHQKYTERGFDCGVYEKTVEDISRKIEEIEILYNDTVIDQIKKKHKQDTDK